MSVKLSGLGIQQEGPPHIVEVGPNSSVPLTLEYTFVRYEGPECETQNWPLNICVSETNEENIPSCMIAGFSLFVGHRIEPELIPILLRAPSSYLDELASRAQARDPNSPDALTRAWAAYDLLVEKGMRYRRTTSAEGAIQFGVETLYFGGACLELSILYASVLVRMGLDASVAVLGNPNEGIGHAVVLLHPSPETEIVLDVARVARDAPFDDIVIRKNLADYAKPGYGPHYQVLDGPVAELPVQSPLANSRVMRRQETK